MTVMKHWLVFSVFMTILVSFFASQIEAKKSKPKGCVGPNGKIYKWKDVLDVDECYEQKCTKKRKWRQMLKREECCKYRNTVLPNLSQKEIDGVMFLCFNGNMKEIPSNKMQVNRTIIQGVSNETLRTERIVPLELQHFDMFEDNRAVFQFSNNERALVDLQKDEDGCIYRGTFKQEIDSLVLVTGCEGEEKSIQIQSLLYGDILATVVNGSVLLPKDIDKLIRVTHMIRSEVDYIEDPEYLKLFSNRSHVRFNIIKPRFLALPVRVYMSPSWRNKFGGFDGGRRKANEIFNHVKYWFLHRSLGTKMYVLTVDEEYFSTNLEYTATEGHLAALGSVVQAPASGHAAIVYLTAVRVRGCGLGIAYVNSICSSNRVSARSINKWDTSDLFTAQTVAHEIGHNLGYYHDFEKQSHRPWTCGPGESNNGPDIDLMNYAGRCGELVQNKWSTCSNDDFMEYFSKFNKFCLETLEETSGTKCVTSPGYPNLYPDNHNGENGAMIPLLVEGDRGYGIEITFYVFDVEYHENCAYDYVQIYDGYGKTVGPKLCGNSLPHKITVKSTSSAAVYFKSDHNVRKKGFKLCYKKTNEWCATVYEHCGYRGEHIHLRKNTMFSALNYDGLWIGHWNDRISSFRLRSGCTLEYGRHHYFHELHTATQSDSCLVVNGMNDEISSIYCSCS